MAFCDPSGKDLGRLQGTETAEILAEIRNVARKYPAGPAPAGAPVKPAFQEYSTALLQRTGPKPVLIFFYDESPASDTVNRSLSDPLLKELRNRFLLTQAELQKGSELCTRCDVLRAPTLLLLDPAREKVESQPLGRITGSRSPRELQRDLEELLGGASPSEARPGSAAASLAAHQRGQKAKAIATSRTYPKHVLTKDVKELLDSLKK